MLIAGADCCVAAAPAGREGRAAPVGWACCVLATAYGTWMALAHPRAYIYLPRHNAAMRALGTAPRKLRMRDSPTRQTSLVTSCSLERRRLGLAT